MYVSNLGIGTHFIWGFISAYVDKWIAKVPTSSKIGVNVQGSTSEIWNSPYETYTCFYIKCIQLKIIKSRIKICNPLVLYIHKRTYCPNCNSMIPIYTYVLYMLVRFNIPRYFALAYILGYLVQGSLSPDNILQK